MFDDSIAALGVGDVAAVVGVAMAQVGWGDDKERRALKPYHPRWIQSVGV